MTGEIVAEAETILNPEILDEIQDCGVDSISVKNDEGRVIKLFSNKAVSIDPYIAGMELRQRISE